MNIDGIDEPKFKLQEKNCLSFRILLDIVSIKPIISRFTEKMDS